MMSAACVSVRVEVRVPTEVRYYPVNEKVAGRGARTFGTFRSPQA